MQIDRNPDPSLVNRLDRHGIKVIEALTSLANRHHELRFFQHSQVLHHRCPVDLRKALDQLPRGERPCFELIANRPANRIGQRFKDSIKLV